MSSKDDYNKLKYQQNIIIYNTIDGKASVSLYAKDGMVWMNQNQLAELFDTGIFSEISLKQYSLGPL